MPSLSKRPLLHIVALMVFLWAGQPLVAFAQEVRAAVLFHDVQVLASDAMQGRKTGTEGNRQARAYIIRRLKEIGLEGFRPDYSHPFTYRQVQGTNVVAYVKGQSEKYIVVSAHYDHLGIQDGQIFNGADDNASGVAAALQLAGLLKQGAPPRYSWLFVFFDAEEAGLLGARAFVEQPPVPLKNIVLNINFDMLSRSKRHELYVCGTAHYPKLRNLVERCVPPPGLRIVFGHDVAKLGMQDWTNASDHYAFHRKGIPFLYFGVEDHPDYHRPTDDYEHIDREFYLKTVEYLAQLVKFIDKHL